MMAILRCSSAQVFEARDAAVRKYGARARLPCSSTRPSHRRTCSPPHPIGTVAKSREKDRSRFPLSPGVRRRRPNVLHLRSKPHAGIVWMTTICTPCCRATATGRTPADAGDFTGSGVLLAAGVKPTIRRGSRIRTYASCARQGIRTVAAPGPQPGVDRNRNISNLVSADEAPRRSLLCQAGRPSFTRPTG